MAKHTKIDEKRYLSIREMQELLGVSKSLAYNMVYRREIPFSILGTRRYVIDRVDIDKYLQKTRREAL